MNYLFSARISWSLALIVQLLLCSGQWYLWHSLLQYATLLHQEHDVANRLGVDMYNGI
jgi:hypothetical protein